MPVTLHYQSLHRLHGFPEVGRNGGGLWGRIELGLDELQEARAAQGQEEDPVETWLGSLAPTLSLDSGSPSVALQYSFSHSYTVIEFLLGHMAA